MKTLMKTFIMTVLLGLSYQTYAADQCDTPSGNPNASAKQKCVDQVNLEDMRVKSGEVNGNTLTLRVEDQAKTQGRSFIYGKDVDIDVTGLNQSEGVSTNATNITNNYNAINNNTQSIVDMRSTVATNSFGIESNRQAINSLRGDLNDLRGNLSAGIASAIAVGQHQFNPSYQKGQISISTGYYRGENAMSFAMGVPIIQNRVFFSSSVAADTGSYGASGGAGVTFMLQ